MLLGLGFLGFAVPEIGTPFWYGYLPGVLLTAAGIALLVAPVTTVVMGSVDPGQSGIASGINSAVARGAILLSVAVLGAIHFAQFERAASARLDELKLDPEIRSQMQQQLINMAAAEIPPEADAPTTQALREIIAGSFLYGARVVMLISGALSILGAFIAFVYIDRPQRDSPFGSGVP
jgi:hypothetical protein